MPYVRAFHGDVLSLFPLSFFLFSPLWLSHGLLSHFSSLRLSSGDSGLVLTLNNAACAALFSPCLMVVDTSVWATSPLGVSVSHIICRFYLFIFSSWLCCSLRFQNSPTGPLVRGFPDIWKLLFFYDSFSGTGLHPQLFCLSFYRLYFVLLSFEENGLPSGCLVSSARVQRLFCCVCSVFK